MVQVLLIFVAAAALVGCTEPRAPESWGAWFDTGLPYDVTEPVAFTSTPYDFPADASAGIAQLPGLIAADQTLYFGADESLPANDCAWRTSSSLPREIEGIVTIHPRYYFKTDGCVRDDEKYYGSFFIQDRTGGIFVLGDSKVAHFDQGARVKMKVRGVVRRFDLPMIAVHDIVEIDRGPYPIYSKPLTGPLGPSDVGEVRQVTGVVATAKDTFGAFNVRSDDGFVVGVSLDVELSRRGVDFPVGTELTVNGPVMYSFGEYSLSVMRIGQVDVIGQ